MNFKSNKVILLILAIVALVCSRAVFFLINDPEGPNLLVVIGLAAVLYCVFLTVYFLIKRTRHAFPNKEV